MIATSIFSIIIIFLIYFLAKFSMAKYFTKKKESFNPSQNNYLPYLGFSLIFAAFSSLNPSTNMEILNLIIQLYNYIFKTSFSLIDTDISIYSIIVYIIFCFAILSIIALEYRNKHLQTKTAFEKQKEEYKTINTIKFPDQTIHESPFFELRIKELFELKYKRQDLQLKELISQDTNKILYGTYEDDFNTIVKIIYCDSKSISLITSFKIKEIQEYLTNEIFKKTKCDDTKKTIAHYYYISSIAKFESSTNNIKCLTEDEFIKGLIDFNYYLKKKITNYKNDKLFSAISEQEKRKTLAETFIEPAYIIGENKKASITLYKYISEWINNTNENKHLAILGDYGMGKTSFAKYLTYRLSENILSGNSFSRFPVYISLTNCSPMHGGISKNIKSFVAEYLGVDYALFNKLVEKGKILFILDAYDEMGFIGTNQQRFKQFNEIWQLATKNNKIVFTGRPSYFPTEFELKKTLALPEEGYEIVQTQPYAEKLTLKPLDDKRMQLYIEKYYQQKATIYFRWIKSNKSLYELCKRPSMMHIIREMLEDLYNSKDNYHMSAGYVIKRYINYWINRQESKKIQSAFEGTSAKKEDFIVTFFTKLAVEFYLSDKLKISSEDILNKITEEIRYRNLPILENIESKEGFCLEILTGYFIERDGDDYKFVHKSFFEFFIASKIKELIKQNKFNDPLMLKSWSLEVMDFIYDVIPENKKENKNIPALLSLANNHVVASIKLSLFKLETLMFKYLIYIYVYLLFTQIILVIKDKIVGVETNKDMSIPLSIIGILIIFTFIMIFGVLKVYKCNQFTEKALILGISKNEKCTYKYMKYILARPSLTINISNIELNKIYTRILIPNKFTDSNLENISFSQCKYNSIRFFNSTLTKIKFMQTEVSSLEISDCQLKDIDFSELRFKKSPIIIRIIYRYIIILRHINNILFKKDKKLLKIKSLFTEQYSIKKIKLSSVELDEISLKSLYTCILSNNISLTKECLFLDKDITRRIEELRK
ncbi:pentapeptide repeat-containing protein [uncultured Bacteroides sp.]|uniref:pentapeptide repeat-containing protein n=1 Tax=uncultured Bacteroides sp. TaxID=162156 RepID=UPI002AAB7221|nr:pentapeptide repeat-containing protein [uncultured Bacteroides sp.]